MASLTRRRMPSAKPPLAPCSVRSCRTVFKSLGFVWWVVMDLLWMCLVTPQQETIMARPRPVLGGGSPPLGAAALRLATLASAPPPPKGGWAEGRRAIYRTTFTPTLVWLCTPESMPSICLVYGFVVALGGLQPFLVQSSRFDVRRSTFSLPPEPQTQESHPPPICRKPGLYYEAWPRLERPKVIPRESPVTARRLSHVSPQLR